MTQDPSGKNKELEDEIERVVDGGAPSSYSWIDEYVTSRIPTPETPRPARRKTRSKARTRSRAKTKTTAKKAKKRSVAKARKTRVSSTKKRKTPRTKTRSTKKRTARTKTRSAKKKTSRRGGAKKAKKGEARTSFATRQVADADPLRVVKEAVETMPPSGRFGDKVYIASAWKRGRGQLGKITLTEFKRWLIDQNRMNHLVLARADLPDAMNRKLVEESEIRSLGSTFHMIIDPNHSDW